MAANAVYYNDSSTLSSGTWSGKNNGNIIGGGDGNSGHLNLSGTSEYSDISAVGFDGAIGTLTINESSKSTGDINLFKVGSATASKLSSNTDGTLNIVGPSTGNINFLGLRIGDTSVYDRYTVRDKSVTGAVNILDGATVNIGATSQSSWDASNNVMWIGSGNAANTGILNISGEGSSLSLINKKIEESSYYDDSMVNGDAYLGYLGHAVVNVTNGGTFTAGRIVASFLRKSDIADNLAKLSTTDITVNGKNSKIVVQSLMALASNVGGRIYDIDFSDSLQGVGKATLTVEDGGEVNFEGKSYIADDGYEVATSGLFLASDQKSDATVNLNHGGTISISNSVLSSEEDGIIAGLGKYAFNLNGGTLRVNSCKYCDNQLTTSVDMNVLSVSFLEADENKSMSLKGNLIGAGGIVKNGTGTVILSGKNNYLGGTRVEAGELRSENDDAFVNNTAYIINGGMLNQNSHDLVMSSLSGAGGIANVTDASLIINQNNNSYFAGEFTGSGTIEKIGNAQLALSGDSSKFSGITTVSAGNLDSTKALGGHIIVKKDALLSATGLLGATDVLSGANLIVGSLYQGNSPKISALTIDGSIKNTGNVFIGGLDNNRQSMVGNRLIVNGDYHGGGSLYFNTVLGDDNSQTDHLSIAGDTNGNTTVYVKNVGGNGDYTQKGIELINVLGESNGNFVQGSRIVAGSYDYFLQRGNHGNGTDEKSWYLTNFKPAPIPEPKPDPEPIPDPEPVPDPKPTPEPEPNPQPRPKPTVRPEAGGYAHNIAAANSLFILRLHDRLGETYYTDVFTGEQKVTSMWMRHAAGHTQSRDSSGQLQTQANRYVMQLGGDIAQWSRDESDRWHLGLMAGYGNSHNNTRSSVTNYRADSSISGYSLGAYGTWQQDEGENTGAYVDTWALYNWFNNKVKGEDLSGESYQSKGWTASVETGYTYKLNEFTGSHGSLNSWFIQPQAQIVWMGVTADSHTESNGTPVSSYGDGNLLTRLGIRSFMKGHHKMDDNKGNEFEPFIEVNWLHNTKSFGTKMGDTKIEQAGTKNIGEIKVGVESQIKTSLNLWGNIAAQVGDQGYNDSLFMVGIKYNFK